jgi:hypothetical protein
MAMITYPRIEKTPHAQVWTGPWEFRAQNLHMFDNYDWHHRVCWG